MATRFEKELSGMLGEFWKKDAERRIADMEERAYNGEIALDDDAAAYWTSNGRYLPSECVEVLRHTGFFFDAEATDRARDEQVSAELASYRQTRREPSFEEMMEMRAAFGAGTTVVDVLTGQTYNL